MRRATMLVLFLVSAVALGADDSLEKAKTLRSNGLLAEAKKELVDVLYASTSQDALKADALLMLGEIAVDEKKFDAARQNWTKVLESYPDSPGAAAARAKLDLLAQMDSRPVIASENQTYRPGTILVLPDEDYAWAHVEIAAALGEFAVPVDDSLAVAVKLAASDTNIVGLVQVDLSVDVPFESGRVVCYQRSGAKVWQKVVRMTYPGTAEAIAHRFIARLGRDLKGKRCP